MIAGFGLATLCCSALGGRSFWGWPVPTYAPAAATSIFPDVHFLHFLYIEEQIVQAGKSQFVSRQQKEKQ